MHGLYQGCSWSGMGLPTVSREAVLGEVSLGSSSILAPYPVDNAGNGVERPRLTKKRRRNSSLGSERVDKRQKQPSILNLHHLQN